MFSPEPSRRVSARPAPASPITITAVMQARCHRTLEQIFVFVRLPGAALHFGVPGMAASQEGVVIQ